VDTEFDPYNIKKGFFWAHMGWLIFGKYRFYYTNVDDLIKSRLIMHQAKHYVPWAIVAGVVTPVLIGSLFGHALSAFILSVCLRVTLVYHSTWCINSVCHTFGKRTYDKDASARDHWLVAILTFGEGYHNFHHRFPSDYRNGVKWYHWDPSKWMIAVCEKIGLARDLMRVPEASIVRARASL
jgi:stearoyl-CoA desaturase (delta-9 desaturase)